MVGNTGNARLGKALCEAASVLRTSTHPIRSKLLFTEKMLTRIGMIFR